MLFIICVISSYWIQIIRSS